MKNQQNELLLNLDLITMNNNDVLRRVRFIFDFNDTKMMDLFDLGGKPATRAEISDWLKKEDDPAFWQYF